MCYALTNQTAASVAVYNNYTFLGANPSEQLTDKPAYVVGAWIVKPLIAKVSSCFSRVVSAFRYVDRATQFPMAAAAKTPDVIRKEMEFLEEVVNAISTQKELRDAHSNMEALIEEAKKRKESDASFAQRALDIVTDGVGLVLEPGPFMIDKVLDGIREAQSEKAFEGVEKVREIDRQWENLKRTQSQEEAREKRNSLIDQHNALVTEIKGLETGDNNARGFAIGIQQAMREKSDRVTELDAEITNLENEMKPYKTHMDKRVAEMQAKNSRYQSHGKGYSPAQVRLFIEEGKDFQKEVDVLAPQIEQMHANLENKREERNNLWNNVIPKLMSDFKLAKSNMEKFGEEIRRRAARLSTIASQLGINHNEL